ncbi:MFS transporter [Pseudonocardiaceae bacterium YIM PH 21723]|nr:MFS transporter [Pseudonocardiaceae bacterium YIM PH 21723]
MTDIGSPRRLSSGEAGVLGALATAVLGYSFLQTSMVTAGAAIQREIGTSVTLIGLAVVGAPLLAGSVCTPLLGVLGDRYGKRRVLIWVLGVYLLSSLVAIPVRSIEPLIAVRAIQGIGLAVLPLGFGLVRETMPDRARLGTGLLSGSLGFAGGISLVAGGLIADRLSWPWLFEFGSVIIALSLLLVLLFVPDTPGVRSGRLDVRGAAVLAGGLIGVLLAITWGPTKGWQSGSVLGFAAVGLVLLAWFPGLQRRTSQPLIDPALLGGGAMPVTHLAAFLLGSAQFVFYILVPQFALADGSYGFAASVTTAGLIVLPGSLIMLLGGTVAGMSRSTWAALSLGFGLMAAGGVALALLHNTVTEVVLTYVVVCLGIGMVGAALPLAIGNVAPPDRLATANGVNAVARTVGGSVGGQLAAAMLAATQPVAAVPPMEAGFIHGFVLAAVLAGVGFLAVQLRDRCL